MNRAALASDVLGALGCRAKMTIGAAIAEICGIRSILEECALPASASGLQLNARRVTAGRRIRTGMHTESYMGPGLC